MQHGVTHTISGPQKQCTACVRTRAHRLHTLQFSAIRTLAKLLETRHGVKIRMEASPVYAERHFELTNRKVFGERNPMKQLGLIMQHFFAP